MTESEVEIVLAQLSAMKRDLSAARVALGILEKSVLARVANQRAVDATRRADTAEAETGPRNIVERTPIPGTGVSIDAPIFCTRGSVMEFEECAARGHARG